jgi:predicted alpha/beta superfamily hydrolase
MKKQLLLMTAFLLVLHVAVQAQEEKSFSRNESTLITSDILDEDRKISIYLPDDYTYSKAKYPVLYLLDGGTHLQHASGAADYLSSRGIVPDIIVVAIHNIDRSRDFSPIHVETIPTSGGAEKFLGFLSEELVPYMDKSYRTAGFNILLGHSFGGTFIAYSLLAEPDLFDGFLAVSPYLMYADNHAVSQTSEKLKPFRDTKFFYMTVGDEEPYFETLETYSSVLQEKAGARMEFKYVKMPEEDHGTTPYLTVFSGLKFIFSGWRLPPELMQSDLETIDAHYRKVSETYGVKIATPELVINALGYRYLQAGDADRAITVFTQNVKRYPGSANVYDSLGEALENKGETEKAAKNYAKAVELGEKSGDPNLPIFKTNLERVGGQ